MKKNIDNISVEDVCIAIIFPISLFNQVLIFYLGIPLIPMPEI